MNRYFCCTLLLATSCQTSSPKPELPPGARAEGTFLHLDAVAAQTATPEAVTQALQSDCDGVCDRLYIDTTADTTPEQLERLIGAARVVSPAPRVFVNTSQGSVEFYVDEAPCEVTVTVRATGAGVMRGRDLLPPDPTCEQMQATICRGDDLVYDWPRLRSEVGTPESVCVAFETGTIEQLGEIDSTLRKPMFRIVPPRQQESAVSSEALTRVIRDHSEAFNWCFEGEVLEKPVPMSLTVRASVHTDGTVVRVEILDGVRTTTQFESCVAAEVEKFKFPDRDTVGVVEFGLDFEPGQQGPTLQHTETSM